MRLSISVNFFDGGELLIPQLRHLRQNAEHLTVVAQDVSNFGNPASEISRDALHDARSSGLVDEVVLYQPTLAEGGARNELRKRQLGTARARAAGASHVMLVDVDEFYIPAQLAKVKQSMVTRQIDYSSVYYSNYYRKPTLRLRGKSHGQKVSLICRLCPGTTHEPNGWYPEPLIDPTRRICVPDGRHYLFPDDEIEMHHMTGVRVDIEEKLANSSNNDAKSANAHQRKLYQMLPKIAPGKVYTPEGGQFFIDEVEDRFELEPWLARFQR